MSNFIEITTEKGDQLININHIVSVIDNEITVTTYKTFPIKCKESYNEIKCKILLAQGEE